MLRKYVWPIKRIENVSRLRQIGEQTDLWRQQLNIFRSFQLVLLLAAGKPTVSPVNAKKSFIKISLEVKVSGLYFNLKILGAFTGHPENKKLACTLKTRLVWRQKANYQFKLIQTPTVTPVERG